MAIPRIFFISKATTPAGGSNPVSVIRMSAADPPLVVKAERINLGNELQPARHVFDGAREPR